jgi:uncharacterized protein YaaR (DUF327 family)
MAKIDSPDVSSFYMNPSAYSQVKEEAKKTRGRSVRRGGETDFSKVFESVRGKTADDLGPLQNLPVSEETVNFLMDEVRSAGDILKERPLPGEILRYKQAVRNFMHYVVKNNYVLEHETGLPNYAKPGYRGSRGTEESRNAREYIKIRVIDKKLEDMAAMLLTSQMNQLKLAASLEEINGLLVDLLQ